MTKQASILSKFISGQSASRTNKEEAKRGTEFRNQSGSDLPVHDGAIAFHVIAAIRTLATLYSNAADMLDRQSRSEIRAKGMRDAQASPDAPSLDPSTFVEDDEEGNAA